MGFKKNNDLWKLRKTHKRSEETKRKISKTNKIIMNKPNIKAKTRLSMLGKTSTKKGKSFEKFYGKERANEIRKKISKSNKNRKNIWCKGLTKETDKRLKKMSENRKGNKNPNWHGGIPYPPKFREIRNEILKRDLFTCQECHRHQNELDKSLQVHHIDFNKQNNISENLISLCGGCHGKTLNSRSDWMNYYKNKMNENIIGVDN